MNAQQLIQETTKESFGDFSVFFKAQSSKVNNLPHSEQKGDKFVEDTFDSQLEICQPPQTSDLLSKVANKINNIKNTETLKGDVIRSMGIEVL